jgi:hypothetical protein
MVFIRKIIIFHKNVIQKLQIWKKSSTFAAWEILGQEL